MVIYIDYLLQELTTFAEEDVLLAMNVFIQRMLGTDDVAELRETTCDSSALELARLLYWLMVVGYNLRSMEVRYALVQPCGIGMYTTQQCGLNGMRSAFKPKM